MTGSRPRFLPSIGPPRPFTFSWSARADEELGEPPGEGDFLSSVRRRDGAPTGSLWRIVSAREVATRDGARRLAYVVIRLDVAAWAMIRPEERVQSFVWRT